MGIDDGRASLALVDIAAQFERLAKGKEAIGPKSAIDHRAPQDQDIDAAVALAGVARWCPAHSAPFSESFRS